MKKINHYPASHLFRVVGWKAAEECVAESTCVVMVIIQHLTSCTYVKLRHWQTTAAVSDNKCRYQMNCFTVCCVPACSFHHRYSSV